MNTQANVNPKKEVYDAIVVGSGISGGWAAKELCEKGLKTLVLERGPRMEHGASYTGEHVPEWQFKYRGRGDRQLYEREYEVQRQCYAMNEATRQFFVNDAEHPYVQEEPFSWIRGYHLGGRSLTWGRQVYRLSDLDFEANAQDGYGVDWPIRYRDLAPWYDYVERHVGVSGEKRGLPQLPDGQFLSPMQMSCVERDVREKVENAYPGRVITIGRVAVLTEAHKGRAPCHYCGPCQRGCSTGSYFSSLSSTLPAAQATGNLTIRCDSVATAVIYDEEKGKATGVRVVDRTSKAPLEFTGRVVFLCASALGSTQILLNSTSRRFPDGLGNDSGALGHYLMDHLYAAGAYGDVDGKTDEFFYGHRPNGIYVPRFRNLGGAAADGLGFTRGYGYQGGANRAGWSRAVGRTGFGADLKHELRRPGRWTMGLGGFGEMLPRKENYAKLDPEKTDAWGMPLLRIRCTHSENERAMKKDFVQQGAEMLEAAGVKNVGTYDSDAPPGLGIHEMGTARMGRDPETSVLNGWNQVHAAPNVFVTDGACMTSSACQNPSITYMALTARAADHAVQEMKRTNL